ncbi:MAG: bifunctional folylpolyglutamate synthase/dihydrofolate synthase [Chloroflexi bacterium]|nr:bifunctional folylpolyglutamate synthase/dihydrofolate synthase [Chloroflexota bacterium]
MSLRAMGSGIVPWRLPPPDTYASSDAYGAAIQRLYAFSETPRTSADVQLGRLRKLDRMKTLLDLLGAPQARFAAILVAGTKGKGSMAALLTSILEAAGYRVGRYTQPHLYSYRERIWACGRYVGQDELVEEAQSMEGAVALVQRAASELGPLTTFDAGTALALLHFSRVGVQIAVVEVGVGGANDATNVLEPILALIGPVGMDHTSTLGPTLTHIAREKAGVARCGIPVVMAPQESEVQRTIREAASARGARVFEVDRASAWSGGSPCMGRFTVHGPCADVADLQTSLAGRFQRENVAMTVTAAQLLDARGWSIPEDAIRQGVASVHWPGRFQTVVTQPLTVVDGAHNGPAARALAATVRECLPARPVTLVLGMTIDKDAHAFMEEVAPVVDRVIVTRGRHQRSTHTSALAEVVRRAGVEPRITPIPADAVEDAWAITPTDGVTLVSGSLFLVGDVLEWLLGRMGMRGQGSGARGQEPGDRAVRGQGLGDGEVGEP